MGKGRKKSKGKGKESKEWKGKEKTAQEKMSETTCWYMKESHEVLEGPLDLTILVVMWNDFSFCFTQFFV